MSTTHTRTTWGPVDETRPIAEVFADPATTEDFIMAYGIHSTDALAAAMTRTNKGPTLIRAILDDVTRASWVTHDLRDQTLRALLNEPGLRLDDLTIMARAARMREHLPVLAAICAHRAADVDLICDTLWNASWRTSGEAARTTATLLPVAVTWVAVQVGLQRAPGPHLGTPTIAQRALICATAARWTAACEQSPELAAFLMNSAYNFTRETELFATGRAIAAAPTRPAHTHS